MTGSNVRKPLCRAEAIADGGALETTAVLDGEAESVVLIRQGDDVRGYWNICPHAGRRLDWAPGQFLIENGLLICAAHGACFQLGNGYCVQGPCRGSALRALPVEVVDGEVFTLGAGPS